MKASKPFPGSRESCVALLMYGTQLRSILGGGYGFELVPARHSLRIFPPIEYSYRVYHVRAHSPSRTALPGSWGVRLPRNDYLARNDFPCFHLFVSDMSRVRCRPFGFSTLPSVPRLLSGILPLVFPFSASPFVAALTLARGRYGVAGSRSPWRRNGLQMIPKVSCEYLCINTDCRMDGSKSSCSPKIGREARSRQELCPVVGKTRKNNFPREKFHQSCFREGGLTRI